MNVRLITFCSIITAVLGAVIGIGVAEVASPPYESPIYQNAARNYAIIGAAAGLLVGAAQESVRELKKKRDREEQADESRYSLDEPAANSYKDNLAH